MRKALALLRVNEKVNREREEQSRLNIENLVAGSSFWIIILITAIAVLEVLGLELVSAPLNSMATQIFNYLPQLLGGVVLIIAAWLIATVRKVLVDKTLSSTRLDEKLSQQADITPMSRNVATAMYWFIILLFLPAILGALQLGGLLDPVKDMVDKTIGIIPNLSRPLWSGWQAGSLPKYCVIW